MLNRSNWLGFQVKGFTLIELLLAVAIMALLGSIAIPTYTVFVDRSRVDDAVADIGILDKRIEKFVSNNFALPDDLAELEGTTGLDPWDQPYQYLRILGSNQNGLQGMVRKDRNLVLINSDYDLYSLGENGVSRPPLTAPQSRDDVVRAGDGSFVGTAEDF